jgi:hypothetical protein
MVSSTTGRTEPLSGSTAPLQGGLWVAVRGKEVLVAAPLAKEVVVWLARHQRAQAMLRVPGSEQAITGAAPQNTPRPVMDIALEGLADAPMNLDTGALRTRMSVKPAPSPGSSCPAPSPRSSMSRG